MQTLLFKNNVHKLERIEIPGEERPRAINLTVRKGLKWSSLRDGAIVELQETGNPRPEEAPEFLANIWDIKVMSFADLIKYPEMLKIEHDPYCQNYMGLWETMKKVYDGFLQHELVTLVFYEPMMCLKDEHDCNVGECGCEWS
jgi:hypothetical protein